MNTLTEEKRKQFTSEELQQMHLEFLQYKLEHDGKTPFEMLIITIGNELISDYEKLNYAEDDESCLAYQNWAKKIIDCTSPIRVVKHISDTLHSRRIGNWRLAIEYLEKEIINKYEPEPTMPWISLKKN